MVQICDQSSTQKKKKRRNRKKEKYCVLWCGGDGGFLYTVLTCFPSKNEHYSLSCFLCIICPVIFILYSD